MKFIYIIFGTILLSSVAFFVKYPIFFYGDSFGYVTMSKELTHDYFYSFIYPLFVRHASLNFSLWFVILLQALILSYILYQTIEFVIHNSNFIKKEHTNNYFITIIAIISFISSASEVCSKLLADVFTPILFLALFLFWQHKKWNVDKIIYLIIALISTLMHYSHSYVVIALLFILITCEVYYEKIVKIQLYICIILIGLSSYFVYPVVHKIYLGEFYYAKNIEINLLSKLYDAGLANDYFKEECAKNNNQYFCEYKDEIMSANDFLWGSKSIFNKKFNHSHINANKEFEKINSAILSKTSTKFKFLLYMGISGLNQLFDFQNIESGGQQIEDGMKYHIPKNYNFDKVSPLKSYQNDGFYYNKIELMMFPFIRMIITFSIIINIFFITRKHQNKEITVLYKFVLATFVFVTVQGFVMGALGQPQGRYQERVIWLLTLTSCFIIIFYTKKLLDYIKNKSI